MIDLTKFSEHFKAYCWEDNHSRHGYPADQFPNFEWIASLERRFAWLRQNCQARHTAAIYLIEEMMHWGGTQGRSLQRLRDGLGEFHLQPALQTAIKHLDEPARAIESALQIPGFGLTYASKLLRFLDPDRYGALDSRIRAALHANAPAVLPVILDSHPASMVKGYVAFTTYLTTLKAALTAKGIERPTCALPKSASGTTDWRAADIEMALFSWADRLPRGKAMARG
ncbi:hypothetical protein LZ683_16490 [Comamonas testosteroni]|uniref:hypothetical protein n=1 Tax=Comamonas testosteroni TaxID=285 RepID=UPI0023AB37D4|nr:hypothetical protein [Comamonas testosteroni]WEE75756.1 hypothetical protein LZ683_16490 [Comamonas testosteroni]